MNARRKCFIYAITGFVLLCSAGTSSQTREEREIEMGEASILASIAVGATPRGRDLCSTERLACVGANKAELGLALIGTRETPASVEALVRLLRFRMDGALGEDYDCYVLERAALSKAYLKRAKPQALENECRSEVAHLVANDGYSFGGLEAKAVCTDQNQIRKHVAQLVSAIGAGHHCSPEDF